MNNMNTSKIIACGATLLLSSCGIYTSYEPQTSVPENLYGEEVTVSDTVSIGNIHWRDFFTDPYLQELIEKGLAQNTDVQTASLRVEEAKASLLSAKLAFPSFLCSFSARGYQYGGRQQGFTHLYASGDSQLGTGHFREIA